MTRALKVQHLEIAIYLHPKEMAQAAADFVEHKLNEAILNKGSAHLILATGASQFSFLEALKSRPINWQKVVVFHLDEYKGLSHRHPASFRRYLKERILDEVRPKTVFFMEGDAADIEAEMNRYASALERHPIDIACIGIGENGHIAFNDPPAADFDDPNLVKVVALDERCRQQQIGEGWFPRLEDVPREAVTLTIPAIMASQSISCVVPHTRKAEAVYHTLFGDIATSCPASILRMHGDARLFLDEKAAARIGSG